MKIRRMPFLLILIAAVMAAPPSIRAAAQDAGKSAEADTGTEAGAKQTSDAPQAPTETVLVEASLPYVPSSNTIATKLPLPLRLTPAHIGIVGSPLLYEQSAEVLGDALKNISGLNVQTQNGIHDYFLIRGFDSLSSGLVLTDGAQEPEATQFQMYNVQRVEVLKGPGGFLYGSNPLSGTVNMVRKQPLPVQFGTIGGSLGSFNRGKGSVDLNFPAADGDFAFRLNSVFREDDHYRDDKESRQLGFNPAFVWRRGEDRSFNLNLEYARAEYRPDSGLPLLGNAIPSVPRRRSYQSPFDFSEQDIYRFQFDWEQKLNDRTRLRSKTYLRNQDWQTQGTFFGGVVPTLPMGGGLSVVRIAGSLDDRQSFIGNQFEAVLDLTAGNVRHQIMAGVEVAQLGDEFTIDAGCLGALTQIGCAPDMSLFAPVETSTGITPIPGQRQTGDSRSNIVAPYIVDQIGFSDEFHLLVGARFDHIDFQEDVSGRSRNDGEVSPMLGFVYAPDETLSFYANGARSFSPPSPRAVGNLRPEDSRQVEVGVKKQFAGGRVQATWAAFRLERDNIAFTDDTGFTQQLGDQRSQGLEFELVAEPMPRLRTFFSYAFTDAELTRFPETQIVGFDFTDPTNPVPVLQAFERAGNAPSFAPEHLASLWVSKKFPRGFGIAGGARHVGDQFIDEDNRFTIDSYTVVDAAVFYERDKWRLKLNLNNVTDTDYEVRGFGAASVIPADPFTAFLGVEFRLQ